MIRIAPPSARSLDTLKVKPGNAFDRPASTASAQNNKMNRYDKRKAYALVATKVETDDDKSKHREEDVPLLSYKPDVFLLRESSRTDIVLDVEQVSPDTTIVVEAPDPKSKEFIIEEKPKCNEVIRRTVTANTQQPMQEKPPTPSKLKPMTQTNAQIQHMHIVVIAVQFLFVFLAYGLNTWFEIDGVGIYLTGDSCVKNVKRCRGAVNIIHTTVIIVILLLIVSISKYKDQFVSVSISGLRVLTCISVLYLVFRQARDIGDSDTKISYQFAKTTSWAASSFLITFTALLDAIVIAAILHKPTENEQA